MNLAVTVCAGAVLSGLVMHRPSLLRNGIGEGFQVGRRVAPEAQRVQIADVQQARVGRPMRRVARDAALGLDHGMLKDKWPCGLGVALGADLVLIGSRLQLLAFESAVRIMTIATSQQPFIDFVMERLGERWLHVCVAGVAEPGLRNSE